MKTLTKLLAGILLSVQAYAQQSPPTIAVFPIDSKGLVLDPYQISNLIRIELDKAGNFTVMDRYDLNSLMEKQGIKVADCYSIACIEEIGKKIGINKVISGSAERYGDKILISLKIVDVKTGKIEKNQINEFLNIQNSLPLMLTISLRDMLGLANDPDAVKKLTSADYASSINNPGVRKLNLSGPRIGASIITGKDAKTFSAAENKGGFNSFPVTSQFGYQFETQYLNSGNFQALFEFLPMVGGLDQGFFLPSVTVLHGLRNNCTGLEFAFGPTFGIATMASGYYDNNGVWHLQSEWSNENPSTNNPFTVTKRIDSRGQTSLSSGFVFAFGKTFRSGALNIPVNVYAVPGQDGWRFGASFGFNTNK